MESKYLICLNRIRSDHKNIIGPKAWSLARLKQIGFRVPDGFVITRNIYSKFIDNNNLNEEINDIITESSKGGRELKQRVEQLQGKILKADIPEMFIELIHNKLKANKDFPFAVRSSASEEDMSGKSFAGLYESYLDNMTVDEVLVSIKKCWASLWNWRAFEYRNNDIFANSNLSMSVIVQKQINPEISGVMFTLNPASADRNQIVIEAVEGMCNKLVLGMVEPYRITVDKKNSEVINFELPTETDSSEKLIEKKRLLSVARKLARTTEKLEKKFNGFQDVEWAWKDDRLYLLQARPVMPLPGIKAWAEKQVWSNLNAGEILPDVVTPATWFVVNKLFERIFKMVYKPLNLRLDDYPMTGKKKGRVYFNLNTAAGIARAFPQTRNLDVDTLLGGHQKNWSQGEKIEIPFDYAPEPKIGWFKFLLLVPAFIKWTRAHRPKKGIEFHRSFSAKLIKYQKLEMKEQSDNRLTELFEELDILLFGKKGVTPLIAYAGVSIQFYFLLSKFCEKYLKDDHHSLTNSLMTGLGGMDSARAGIEIWKLADSAGKNEKIRERLLSSSGYDEFSEKIARLTGSKEYLAQWDRFFREHGHHTRGEIEFINKRWSEDPDYILGIVKAYLGSSPLDPVEEEERQAVNRKTVIAETRKRLKNPLKRTIFNYLLINAQTGSIVRENVKGDAIKVIGVYRRALLETGRRMVERKLIENVDDIFFLDERELRKYLLHARRSPRVLKMIDERKKEREENERITPPTVIMGDVDDNVIDVDPMPDLREMKGLCVSAGLAKGRARVILHTEDGAVEPGEILVAPFTDPGWTPYFIPASGIVMDMGGLLSHGSIIAREYGIPAVVNINGATKIIKTGQMILVDGNKGVVKILDEE